MLTMKTAAENEAIGYHNEMEVPLGFGTALNAKALGFAVSDVTWSPYLDELIYLDELGNLFLTYPGGRCQIKVNGQRLGPQFYDMAETLHTSVSGGPTSLLFTRMRVGSKAGGYPQSIEIACVSRDRLMLRFEKSGS